MKKFILNLLLFLFPLMLLYSIPASLLWFTKESFNDIDELLKSDTRYVIGYGYNQENESYLQWFKLNNKPRCKVVTLGSSRVIQFRRQMFDSSFYNSGRTISNLKEFKPFLESVDTAKYPEYLIISLDQWMFNEAYSNLKGHVSKDMWAKSFSKTPSFNVLWSANKDIFKGKYSFDILNKKSDKTLIGIAAFAKNQGVRNDGSRDYGNHINTLLANDSAKNDHVLNDDTYKRIKKGNQRFQYGSTVNPRVIEGLDDFLAYCKKHKIHVIAFLPPFSNNVNKAMELSGNYTYMAKIFPQINPLFNKYGYELYDYTSLTSFGSNDSEIMDGFHGGEVTYLKLVVDMLKHKSQLNNVTSLKRLENDLLNKKNRYVVYEY